MQLLTRFHEAQKTICENALAEIKNGHKRTHWMWFIFPQLKGLGHSEKAQYYGIDGLTEAKEYLADDVLKTRLITSSQALLELNTNNANVIFGSPDDMKLKSCMTLFLIASNRNPIFQAVLDKFFGGMLDCQTVKLLEEKQ